MAYCGCGTKANKARWCAVFVLLALAVVFLIVNIVVSRDCRVCTTESVNGTSTRVCEDPGYEADRDWDDVEGCSEGAVIATSFLFLVCLVAATVPCCCMCCCATGPPKNVDHAVAIVVKPEDPQQAGYYSHQQAQTYGEPVQAQPVGQPVYAQAQGQQVSGPPPVV